LKSKTRARLAPADRTWIGSSLARWAALSASLVALALPAHADPAAAAALWERAKAPAQIRIEGEHLFFTGEIMEATNPQVYEQYALAQPKPRIFTVTSRGGSLLAAVDLARWILDRGLEVEVQDYCLSSCANYILAAGTVTRISAHAALAWHGGALQQIPYEDATIVDQNMKPVSAERAAQIRERNRAERDRWVADMRAQESAFLSHVGVVQQMTVLGQQERYDATRNSGSTIWDFSLEDLHALGLRQLQVIGGEPWHPPRVLPNGRKLFRISLGDHPELQLPSAAEPHPGAEQP
jgi:hypothetical protein